MELCAGSPVSTQPTTLAFTLLSVSAEAPAGARNPGGMSPQPRGLSACRVTTFLGTGHGAGGVAYSVVDLLS